MAGPSLVREDGSLLSRADRSLHRFETGLTLVAGIVIFLLMLLAVTQILGRKLLNMPVPGFIDWVEQAMAVFAFLGIAYCQRLGGHIRMDILIGQLKGRWLWLAEIVSTLLMLFLTVALTIGSFRHFQRAFDWSAPMFSRDSSIDVALPLWPAKLLIPLALGLLTLRLLLQLWGYVRALRSGTDEPIGVPMILSAAEEAALEAEHVAGAEYEIRGRG